MRDASVSVCTVVGRGQEHGGQELVGGRGPPTGRQSGKGEGTRGATERVCGVGVGGTPGWSARAGNAQGHLCALRGWSWSEGGD